MHAVVTLVEGSFLNGAAALYNSLVANQFDGVFIVGNRGRETLPRSVLDAMESLPEHLPRIEFVRVETECHFTNYKPAFIQKIFDAHPELDAITYLDPDIVVNGPWSWLASWCRHGPAVAGDVNWRMSSDHPTRHQWRSMLQNLGYDPTRTPDIYYNGGLLSLSRRDRGFAELWHKLITAFGSAENPLDGKGEITAWRKEGRSNPLHAIDQDILNMALMVWSGTVCTFGPEAMGFAPGGEPLLPHAVGPDKPWQRCHLNEALRGRPPRLVDKAYQQHAESPIPINSKTNQRRRCLALKLAALVGRFYRRSGC